MTADRFRVGIDLIAHSQQLKGVMDALSEAVEAAKTVSMPTDAYGILCQPFRMMLDPVEKKGMDALNDAVSATERASNEMNSTARSYQDSEETSSARFEGVRDARR